MRLTSLCSSAGLASVAALLLIAGGETATAQTVLIGDNSTLATPAPIDGYFGSFTPTTEASVIEGTPDGSFQANDTTGRVLVPTSVTGQGVQIPGWQAQRVAYMGGNPALGFDGASGSGPDGFRSPGDRPYAFVNSGVVDFVSDPISDPTDGMFDSGDLFTINFGAFQQSGAGATYTATLAFDNGETAELGSITTTAQDQILFYDTISNEVLLTEPATTVTVTIRVDTPTNNQNTFDNVDLSFVAGDPVVAGDVNGDMLVNSLDFDIIAQNSGQTFVERTEGDLVNNDLVDLADYAQWKAAPKDPEPSSLSAFAAVPEPGSLLLVLLTASGLAVTTRR